MIDITIGKAASICGGELNNTVVSGLPLRHIVIDSRKVMPGDMFVAYKGENTDGHKYISAALDNGAACCLAEYVPSGETRPVIAVPDVQEAIEKIAAECRNRVKIPIIGITGSVGKTSAKEMIAAVLSEHYCTLKTEGNLNNTIGVPMMLSRITPEHEVAVIEMGINHFGEMDRLGKMVRPDIAVFTVIGHAHLEFLGDLDGVLRAKTEMLPYLPENGTVVANGDDEKLKAMHTRQKLVLYGTGDNAQIRGTAIRTTEDGCSEFEICMDGEKLKARIPAYGKHLIYAALEGAAVGNLLGLTSEEILRGMSNYRTVGRRAAVVDTGFLKLIDDSYNANPDSVKCGIDSLMKLPGRHICILGEMRELGDDSPQMHRSVGEYAKTAGADLVISCGNLGRELAESAGEKGRWFRSREELIDALPGLLIKDDNVLVKASLTIGFDKVSEAVKTIG